MPEENIQGVDVAVSGHKKWVMNYLEGDVNQIFKDAGVYQGKVTSWQELLQYIEQHGEAQWHITPGIAVAMKEDLEHVIKSGAPFTTNANQAYQEMHKYRTQDMSEEPKIAKEWHPHS